MDRQVPGKFCYRVQNSTQKADGGKFQSVKLIAKLLRPKRQVSAMTAAVVNSKCQKDLLTVLTLNTHASGGLSCDCNQCVTNLQLSGEEQRAVGDGPHTAVRQLHTIQQIHRKKGEQVEEDQLTVNTGDRKEQHFQLDGFKRTSLK